MKKGVVVVIVFLSFLVFSTSFASERKVENIRVDSDGGIWLYCGDSDLELWTVPKDGHVSIEFEKAGDNVFLLLKRGKTVEDAEENCKRYEVYFDPNH